MSAKVKAFVSRFCIAAVFAAFMTVNLAIGGLSVAPADAAGPEAAVEKVVVYYFHGNMRCSTCRKFEAYVKEAIQSGFKKELEDGRLDFRVVNLDEPENEHFVEEYRLLTRSVVISRYSGGKERGWKNLPRIWELVRNKDSFSAYIQEETAAMLKGGV